MTAPAVSNDSTPFRKVSQTSCGGVFFLVSALRLGRAAKGA